MEGTGQKGWDAAVPDKALFPAWADTAFKWAIIFIALAVPAVFVVPSIYLRTPYNLDRQHPVGQPVQFDHRHHVQDDEIPCLYCHSEAERSSVAGVPPTELCMGCHSQIWNSSPMLEPVRRSYFSGQPMPWVLVHDVPDFVFFNHAIHIQHPVDCVTCHGKVEDMALPFKTGFFTMGWCLDCHRRMQPRVDHNLAGVTSRKDQDEPPANRLPHLNPLITCTACHR